MPHLPTNLLRGPFSNINHALATTTTPSISEDDQRDTDLSPPLSTLSQTKLSIVQSDSKQSTPHSRARKSSLVMDHLKHPRLHRSEHHSDDQSKQKRSSLTFRPSSKSRSSDTASPKMQPQPPPRAKINLLIESPPLVFYGSTRQSTGALLTGYIELGVHAPHDEVQVSSFTMQLRAVITVKKPVSKDCHECQQRIDVLQNWTFIAEPKTLRRAEELEFPLSYLFDGGLPATVEDAPLGSIHYFLKMSAQTVGGEETKQIHELKLLRAMPNGQERTAIRIFPPTNLTGRCVMPTAIHPIGSFPIQLVMSGIVEKREKGTIRWRLRKVMWRVEEASRVISHACPKHAHKIGGQGKGQKHEDIRNIGSGEMKDGWKTDFDTAGGEITLQFEVNLTASRKPVCDTDTGAGFLVTHSFVIETIVSEERSISSKRPNDIQSTGAARILRMSFVLPVTERAGMGISWDEEMPPMYEEVPESPPLYPRSTGLATEASAMEEYRGDFDWENDNRSPRQRSNHRPDSRSSERGLRDHFISASPPSYRESDAFPPLDQMGNLEIRSARQPRPSSLTEASRARPQWTTAELEIEPPQQHLRSNESGAVNEAGDDVGVGQEGPGEVERQGS